MPGRPLFTNGRHGCGYEVDRWDAPDLYDFQHRNRMSRTRTRDRTCEIALRVSVVDQEGVGIPAGSIIVRERGLSSDKPGKIVYRGETNVRGQLFVVLEYEYGVIRVIGRNDVRTLLIHVSARGRNNMVSKEVTGRQLSGADPVAIRMVL